MLSYVPPISGFVDRWKTFMCIFQRFEFSFLGMARAYEHVVYFAGFRVPQPCASVSELPAAPQKKHTPGFWNMYFVGVVIYKRF